MSEKTREEKEFERDEVIASLGAKDFEKLSQSQFAMVQRAQIERMNKRARERMDAALKDNIEDVAKAPTEPPFVFRAPEIQIMAGAKVRFTTLVMAQVRDAHRRLDEFIAREDPNNLRSSDFLNRELLAHSLFEFNGRDFGGVSFDPTDYQQLRAGSPEDAQKVLDEVREKRLQAIDDLSPHIVERLIEYYQAFQIAVEALSKSEDMDDALGN